MWKLLKLVKNCEHWPRMGKVRKCTQTLGKWRYVVKSGDIFYNCQQVELHVGPSTSIITTETYSSRYDLKRVIKLCVLGEFVTVILWI